MSIFWAEGHFWPFFCKSGIFANLSTNHEPHLTLPIPQVLRLPRRKTGRSHRNGLPNFPDRLLRDSPHDARDRRTQKLQHRRQSRTSSARTLQHNFLIPRRIPLFPEPSPNLRLRRSRRSQPIFSFHFSKFDAARERRIPGTLRSSTESVFGGNCLLVGL